MRELGDRGIPRSSEKSYRPSSRWREVAGQKIAPPAVELDRLWRRLHGGNMAAHALGLAAAEVGRVDNPFHSGTDEHYWFIEGWHHRPFAPLTNFETLRRLAAAGEDVAAPSATVRAEVPTAGVRR